MRRGDGYRFSLGWSNNSVEKRTVGDLLEALNNRKSDLVVQAVWEYIQSHPELAQPDAKVIISVQSTQTDEQMLAQIKHMIEDTVQRRLEGIKLAEPNEQPQEKPSGPSDADLDEMLANLDIFNQ